MPETPVPVIRVADDAAEGHVLGADLAVDAPATVAGELAVEEQAVEGVCHPIPDEVVRVRQRPDARLI